MDSQFAAQSGYLTQEELAVVNLLQSTSGALLERTARRVYDRHITDMESGNYAGVHKYLNDMMNDSGVDILNQLEQLVTTQNGDNYYETPTFTSLLFDSVKKDSPNTTKNMLQKLGLNDPHAGQKMNRLRDLVVEVMTRAWAPDGKYGHEKGGYGNSILAGINKIHNGVGGLAGNEETILDALTNPVTLAIYEELEKRHPNGWTELNGEEVVAIVQSSSFQSRISELKGHQAHFVPGIGVIPYNTTRDLNHGQRNALGSAVGKTDITPAERTWGSLFSQAFSAYQMSNIMTAPAAFWQEDSIERVFDGYYERPLALEHQGHDGGWAPTIATMNAIAGVDDELFLSGSNSFVVEGGGGFNKLLGGIEENSNSKYLVTPIYRTGNDGRNTDDTNLDGYQVMEFVQTPGETGHYKLKPVEIMRRGADGVLLTGEDNLLTPNGVVSERLYGVDKSITHDFEQTSYLGGLEEWMFLSGRMATKGIPTSYKSRQKTPEELRSEALLVFKSLPIGDSN